MMAWVMVELCKDKLAQEDEAVIVRGDNSSALTRANNFVGAREVGLAVLMRVLGMFEFTSVWSFAALHIAGTNNTLADDVARWQRTLIPLTINSQLPSSQWQEADLGAQGEMTCWAILQEPFLASDCPRPLWRHIVWDDGDCG